MPSKYGNAAFYNSKAWKRVSLAYMTSQQFICERCGKPAQICHHKRYLNAHNVHDPLIALNFDNLEALCLSCHNREHGIKHTVTVFDDNGNVAAVRESQEAKDYESQREKIDDVVERAKKLLCGLK